MITDDMVRAALVAYHLSLNESECTSRQSMADMRRALIAAMDVFYSLPPNVEANGAHSAPVQRPVGHSDGGNGHV